MDERKPHPIILPPGTQSQMARNPPISFSLQPRAPEHFSDIPEIPAFVQKQKRSPHPSDPLPSIPHPPSRAKPNPNPTPNPNPNPKPQRKPTEHVQRSILPRGQPSQYSAGHNQNPAFANLPNANPNSHLQNTNPHSHQQSNLNPHSHLPNTNTVNSHLQSLNAHAHQQSNLHPHLHVQNTNQNQYLPTTNPQSHLQTSNPHSQLPTTNPHSHLQHLNNPHSQTLNPHLRNPLLVGAQLSPSQLHAQRQQLITAYMGATQPFLLPTGGIPPAAPPAQNPQALIKASPAPKYTQVEIIVAEMRENMIKVLKTSNYKRCKSAKNIRQALRAVRTLCKEMRSETTVLGKQKANARKKATPEREEGPAKIRKLVDGGSAKGHQESPGAGGEDGTPGNPEEVSKEVGAAGGALNGGAVVSEQGERDGVLNREGQNPDDEKKGGLVGVDGNDRTVDAGGAETDGLDDRGEETDSDDD